jgi:abortive infection bacteriophage resistance protein
MAKIPYTKSSLSPKQQVALLASRGIAIPDQAMAEHYLKYHNYYQLSGYVYYFEVKGAARTHRLARPVGFDDIVALNRFDQNLRESFLSAASDIEMAIRSSIAIRLSQAYGPFCFEQPGIFRRPDNHAHFMERLEKVLVEHQNEPFIAHHTITYLERIPPAWVMVEVLTFGNISWLYSQLKTDLQKTIAGDFQVDHMILVSWLKALTELRNSCAHHARLWNKVFVNYPKIRNTDKSFHIIPGLENRLGSFIPMLRHILVVIREKPDWEAKMYSLLAANPLIRPSDMGLRIW